MDLEKRIEILSAGAKYDASCASSCSTRAGANGANVSSGICHSWAADGRCVSLLKILMTNSCIYDCAYCVNRRSGVVGSPDRTMELMLEAVRKLRLEKKFSGYVHLKVIPGASRELIDLAGLYADRVSVNIELPTSGSLALLAPGKTKEGILKPMSRLAERISASRDERRSIKSSPAYAPGGQSTQLIVGATSETDLQIMRLSDALYKKMSLKRVYYSAFVPVSADSRLPALPEPPLRREHRLYQADWLLRFYGFSVDELLNEKCPCLDLTFDPKTMWALNNLDKFPLEVNTADYTELLRVPGIGVLSAKRIVRARRAARLRLEDLGRLGVVMKRAVYFVTAGGIYDGLKKVSAETIKTKLLEKKEPAAAQPSLFEAAAAQAEV